MSETDAPLDERWSTGDILTGVSIVIVYVVMVLTLALTDPYFAAALVFGMLFVALGYESGLIPQFIWEVKRRV